MGRFIPNENTVVLFTLSPPGGIAAPVVTSTTATTGGTLVAATYGYRVVALDAFGHSGPSVEKTQVVPAGTATNTVTVNWTAVTGETAGYDIYGRTAGGEQKIGHVAHGVATFVDTGAVVPAGILPTGNTSANIAAPSLANDITPAIDLTDLTSSFNASSQGNAVPTPSFKRLFETSILGTSQATFTADFYRDDDPSLDLAWETLIRGTKGWFIVTRHGGAFVVGQECEVWPVTVLSAAMSNMANNTVSTFTVTCAVPNEPDEHAVVVA